MAAADGLLFLIDVALGSGRACPAFHADRSSLVGAELNHLQGKGGARSADFMRLWQAMPPKT